MNENPLLQAGMLLIGLYVAWLWWSDLKENQKNPKGGFTQGLPGATPASPRALWIAAAGAAVILAAETLGEIALNLSEEQTKMTVLFGLYTLVAAIIEEIIFRGYIVVEGKGRAKMIAGVLAASLLFSLIHPFLWKWDDDGFALTLTPKGWFSFGAVFIGSLWFYACRLASWNPQRSLLPCFVAHGVKNLGVFAIKLVQGFVVGLW
ncbi:MAG: CPBP family intramembrane metalloprotease [Burkholderiales bacterium]|nr:CPBP family intramembrane metalloprotease [Opitutaceae bacterium]